MSTPPCDCSMRVRLVGDGCAVCNPEFWEDYNETTTTATPPWPSTESRAMDDCTHRNIQSWQDEDGNPADFWSCRECGRRFEPVAGPGTEEGGSNVP